MVGSEFYDDPAVFGPMPIFVAKRSENQWVASAAGLDDVVYGTSADSVARMIYFAKHLVLGYEGYTLHEVKTVEELDELRSRGRKP